jgi:hypothetical protein
MGRRRRPSYGSHGKNLIFEDSVMEGTGQTKKIQSWKECEEEDQVVEEMGRLFKEELRGRNIKKKPTHKHISRLR